MLGSAVVLTSTGGESEKETELEQELKTKLFDRDVDKTRRATCKG